MTDTKELRKLAKAATPGPWVVGSKTNTHWKRAVGFGDKPSMNSVAFCGHSEAQAHKDAAYIAGANPVVVIELLKTIGRLTEARDNAVQSAKYTADLCTQALADLKLMTDDRNSWQKQASDRVDDAVRFAAERDALAKAFSDHQLALAIAKEKTT